MNNLFDLRYQDKHLNVFWSYNGAPGAENNITKAFINTINSLPILDAIVFLRKIGIDCEIESSDGCRIEFYLQKKPDLSIVEIIPEEARFLLAFSPTGKSWGYEGIDIADEKTIKAEIEKAVLKNSQVSEDELKQIVKNELREIQIEKESRGGSIPDGWIILYKQETPILCVALENKLYDLNPFQLKNHLTKSLLLPAELNNHNPIIYKKYTDIISAFSEMEGYLVAEFLRYLYFLGYWKTDRLDEIPRGFDDEVVNALINKRVIKLLDDISQKGAKYHRNWMWKIDIENDSCKEIGIIYRNGRIQIYHYFGSTQNRSRYFWKSATINKSEIESKYEVVQSFHFQNSYSKNLGWSYYDGGNTGDYISFWEENISLLKQSGAEERTEILDKMFSAGIIPENAYKAILQESNKHNEKLNICSELLIKISIDIQKAIELDSKHGLEKYVINEINGLFKSIGVGECKGLKS